MTVHELIEKLQEIPNQNMEVYVTSEYDEEPLEQIEVGYIWEDKVLFVDNYGHDTEPKKKPEPKPLTQLERFWIEHELEELSKPIEEWQKNVLMELSAGSNVKIKKWQPLTRLTGLDSDMVIIDEGVCDE